MLGLLQGVVRADIAVLFYGALFVYVPVRGAKGFLVSRRTLLAASALGAALAASTLAWMMFKVYPHATYGDTAVVQLRYNFSLKSLIPFALCIVPIAYAYTQSLRVTAAPEPDAVTQVLLLAGVLYFLSWAVLGRLEEVRIFAPFAIAPIPLTANIVGESIAAYSDMPASMERAA